MPDNNQDLALVEKAIHSFKETQESLDRSFGSAVQRLDSQFRAVDECVDKHQSQLQEYKRIARMLRSIRGDVDRDDQERFDRLTDEMSSIKDSLDNIRDLKPRTHSALLRFTLGRVNVKMWKKSDHMNFRDEYNKFKERTTYIFTGLPLLQLFVMQHPLLWMMHRLWILYYYLSLALRENILQANGSNIKDWWIVHHYITIVIMLASLLSQSQLSEREYREELWIFLVLQGVVMFMQNRYQERRHYVRRSLGKAKDMDVSSTETIVEKPSELTMMIPLLFLVYVFEVGFGVYMYTMNPSLLTFFTGLLWVILGIGNGVTTGYVLFQKRKKRRKKSRTQ